MSLFIVGSCSMFTQRVVLALSKINIYQRIVILDPLPFYHFHNRFYDLQQKLEGTSTSVHIEKMIQIEDIAAKILEHKNTLFVPHDYFSLVMAKQKMLQITTKQAVKTQTPLVIAAPFEYCHMKENHPFRFMHKALDASRAAMPKCTVLTADALDSCDLAAYMRNITMNFKFPALKPRFKLVNTDVFVSRVVTALQNHEEGVREHYEGTQDGINPPSIPNDILHTAQNMNRVIYQLLRQPRAIKCSAQS